MEDFYVLNKESVNKCDPHGYFSDVGRRDLNFKSPTKRLFLNECIRQIHIMNGNDMPIVSTIPVQYSKGYLWNALNTIMMPPKISTSQALIERVKRRLFREPKGRPRKVRYPKFNDRQISECVHIRAFRHILGIRKIQRNYLEQARIVVDNDIRQNLKRKHCEVDDESQENSAHFSINQREFEVSQQVINEVCRYNGNMARNHTQCERSMEEQLKRERNTESCRLSRRAKRLEQILMEQQYRERSIVNEKVLEASIRSILYMKTLMVLMVGKEDNSNLCS